MMDGEDYDAFCFPVRLAVCCVAQFAFLVVPIADLPGQPVPVVGVFSFIHWHTDVVLNLVV